VRFQPVVGNSEIELELTTNEFLFLKLPITHVSNSWNRYTYFLKNTMHRFIIPDPTRNPREFFEWMVQSSHTKMRIMRR